LKFKRYDENGYSSAVRLDEGCAKLLELINSEFKQTTELRENITSKEAIRIIDIISSWRRTKKDLTSLKSGILGIKSPLPLGKMLHGGRHKHRMAILKLVYEYMGVTEDLYNARRTKYKALKNYISGYILLVECKEASLRISKESWKNSCSSIFK
jgi:hypothetical protein